MNKAYKFRIYPNEEQREKIEKTFNCVRFIYNRMLTDKMEFYSRTGQKLNNTPAQYKKTFPWLKEVDSLALANAQMHLQAAYENFFRNPSVGFPKFKSKRHTKKTFTTNCVNGNIIIHNSAIRLPKIGFIKIKLHRVIPNDFKLKSVTVSRNAKGDYYASVLFEYKPSKAETVPENIIELEYSDKGLYVDSNGKRIDYPFYIQKTIERLRREKKRLSHMKKGSMNREKQRIKIMIVKEKFYNQRYDFLHKQSRQIANAYDGVRVKDPAESVSYDFGWTIFKFLLKYKLSDAGKKLISADEILLSKMLYSFQAV